MLFFILHLILLNKSEVMLMKKEQYDYIESTLRELSLYIRNARIEQEKEEFRKQFFIIRDNTKKTENNVVPLHNKTEDLQLKNYNLGKVGIYEIFTEKEINKMPKEIRKIIINKKRCTIRKHPTCKGYEIRFRKNGYYISASGPTVQLAKENFLKKVKTATPKIYTLDTIPKTFNAFTTYFFENFRKKKVSEQTYCSDLNRYNNYLKTTFKEKLICQIAPIECQKLIDKIKEDGKGKTADEIYSLMSIIFKGAIKHDIIDKNPLDVIYHEKHQRKHGSAFTFEEEQRLRALILASNDQKIKIGLALMLFTGLRPNELKTVKCDKNFIIAINSKRKNKKIEYKKIPIIKALKPFISAGINVSFSDRTLDKMRATIKKEFPNHILYDLRTTFYSRCKEFNVSESARDSFVGHSLGELGNAYTDLSDEYLLREGKKLDKWK